MKYTYACNIKINKRYNPVPAIVLLSTSFHKDDTVYSNFVAKDLYELADKLEEAAEDLRAHGLPS